MEEYHQLFQSIQIVTRGVPIIKFLDLDWRCCLVGSNLSKMRAQSLQHAKRFLSTALVVY